MKNLAKLIEKENKRVSYEWDAFLAKYGPINNYDELSEEGKRAACELAEKQGDRHNAILGIEHVTPA